jgi:hypothetical protein
LQRPPEQTAPAQQDCDRRLAARRYFFLPVISSCPPCETLRLGRCCDGGRGCRLVLGGEFYGHVSPRRRSAMMVRADCAGGRSAPKPP